VSAISAGMATQNKDVGKEGRRARGGCPWMEFGPGGEAEKMQFVALCGRMSVPPIPKSPPAVFLECKAWKML
jgi:hypothetical protein